MEEAALPPDNLTLPDPQGFGVTVQVGETDSWSFADTLTVDINETIPNNLVIIQISQIMVNIIVLFTL